MVDSRRYSVFIIDISRPLGGFMVPEPRLMGSCVLWLQTKSLPKEWRTMVPPCHQNIPRPPLATVDPTAIFLLSIPHPPWVRFRMFVFFGDFFWRAFPRLKIPFECEKMTVQCILMRRLSRTGTKKGRMSICVIGEWVFFNVENLLIVSFSRWTYRKYGL